SAHQRINIQRHKVGRHVPETLRYFIGKAMLQHDVAPLDVAEVSETFHQCREQWSFFLRVTGMPQNSNFWDAGLLLRTGGNRPRCRRAKKCNELAPLHVPPENKPNARLKA